MEFIINQETLEFEKDAQEKGIEFQFITFNLNNPVSQVEVLHRTALDLMFKPLQYHQDCYYEKLKTENPQLTREQLWRAEYTLPVMTPEPLSQQEIRKLIRLPDIDTKFVRSWEHKIDPEDTAPLYYAFVSPPYGIALYQGKRRIKQQDHQKLFHTYYQTWLETIGLIAEDNVSVLDWVGNCETEPERSAWSNFFEAGKEWWGVWCLTIYNPVKQKISVVMASTTD